jgi:uncharacterized membrane protein YkvA (DUF1232 family)
MVSSRFKPEKRAEYFADLVRDAKLAWSLFWDPRVSLLLKLVPLFGVLYLFFPENLILSPFAGNWSCCLLCFPISLIDDLLVLAICVRYFVSRAPKDVLQELRERNADWKVVE